MIAPATLKIGSCWIFKSQPEPSKNSCGKPLGCPRGTKYGGSAWLAAQAQRVLERLPSSALQTLLNLGLKRHWRLLVDTAVPNNPTSTAAQQLPHGRQERCWFRVVICTLPSTSNLERVANELAFHEQLNTVSRTWTTTVNHKMRRR